MWGCDLRVVLWKWGRFVDINVGKKDYGSDEGELFLVGKEYFCRVGWDVVFGDYFLKE